jgi:nucleoside-diphosphate-sugar epimerase
LSRVELSKGIAVHVLITGGTGFIGSRLALACLAKQQCVSVLGQANTTAEAANQRLLEARGASVSLASVTDRQSVFASLPGVDLVYHLAAAQHETNVPDQQFWDVNVTGTQNVLDASISAGVQRFVHGSTIGVYGSAGVGYLDERSPLRPDNIYGLTKAEGEKLVRAFDHRLPTVIIRLSETYGPGDLRLLKLFKAIQKGLFFMVGSGRNWHQPIYVDDLIGGLQLAASAENAVGKTIVLAGKEPLSSNDMVRSIADEMGTGVPSVRAPLPLCLAIAVVMEILCRPVGLRPPLHRRRMDFFRKSFRFRHEEALKHLGFVAKYNFREGIAEVAKWYRRIGYL